MRILLVEDDAMLAQAVGRALKQAFGKPPTVWRRKRRKKR